MEVDVKALVAVVDLNAVVDLSDGLDFDRTLLEVNIALSIKTGTA